MFPCGTRKTTTARTNIAIDDGDESMTDEQTADALKKRPDLLGKSLSYSVHAAGRLDADSEWFSLAREMGPPA